MGRWLEQYKGLVFGILVALTGGLAVWWYLNQSSGPTPATALNIILPTETPTSSPTATETASPTSTNTPTPAPTNTPQPLRVYISGAVNKPGVYFVQPGSIISDVIVLAEGAIETADLEVVNLAIQLKDQQQIHIPTQADNLPTPPVISSGVDATPTPPPTLPPKAANSQITPANPASTTGNLINLNTASAAELEIIKGIGPATAEKIIAYREANGGFKSIEEIVEVKGIGPVTLEKMRAQITVD